MRTSSWRWRWLSASSLHSQLHKHWHNKHKIQKALLDGWCSKEKSHLVFRFKAGQSGLIRGITLVGLRQVPRLSPKRKITPRLQQLHVKAAVVYCRIRAALSPASRLTKAALVQRLLKSHFPERSRKHLQIITCGTTGPRILTLIQEQVGLTIPETIVLPGRIQLLRPLRGRILKIIDRMPYVR